MTRKTFPLALLALLAAAPLGADDLAAWHTLEEEFFRRGYPRLEEADREARERIQGFRFRCRTEIHEDDLPRPERIDFLVLLDRVDRLLAAPARRPSAADRHRHHWTWEFGVDRTLEEVLEEALQAFATTRREMEELAQSAPGGLGRRAFDERIGRDHPAADDLLETARTALEHARSFTLERDFVTVPDHARDVRVRWGDPAADTPFGHYWPTGAPGKKPGYYVVIPVDRRRDEAERDQILRANNRPWTEVVAVHEAIPGHHLQLTIAAHGATRMRRTVYNSAFVEGWALYCENLLARLGYFDTPEERFAQLKMRLWRIARVVVDLGLHCAGIPREELERLLVDGVGLEAACARSELNRIGARPNYYSGYFVGWTEIEALRRDCERAWGARFTERAFHDALLECGQVPFRVVRRVLLSE